jgi:hypothetical protein
MAESRPCFRKPKVMRMLFVILLVGSLWMGNALTGKLAGGQPPKIEPQSITVPPTANLVQPTPVFAAPPPPIPRAAPVRTPFNFVINPDTPLKDLLPIPPKARAAEPRLIDDIAQVPEVAFQEPLAKSPEALKSTAHTIAKINHLNRQKTDGFIEALLQARPDLAGLPMAMGDTCRTKGDRTKFFTQALNTIKQARGANVVFKSVQTTSLPKLRAERPLDRPPVEVKVQPRKPQPAQQPGEVSGVVSGPGAAAFLETDVDGVSVDFLTSTSMAIQNADPDAFWEKFGQLCFQEDKSNTNLDPSQLDHVTCARIAALMQVLGPESVAMRKGLVKYLAATSHAEATRALAKLAIFSAEDEVRNPAIEALKVRREKDYTEVLLRGMRYPLPAVAKRAADAMVKLERADLVPELVSFLEEPDPRAPTIKEVGEKKVPVVRELVRINHHRNCLMCHSPGVQGEFPQAVTTAEVPRPDQPLPFPSDGYNNSIPDVLVRLDVTYLRQDFSLMQPVADANPWPEMQRFDFLVRDRVLTDDEAAALPAPKADTLSPYQRFTLAALRELTGKDAAPTPEAWRKLLELPARGSL